jgi:hypothetical protein
MVYCYQIEVIYVHFSQEKRPNETHECESLRSNIFFFDYIDHDTPFLPCYKSSYVCVMFHINDLQPRKFTHYYIWSNVDGQLHLNNHGCDLLQLVTMNNEN